MASDGSMESESAQTALRQSMSLRIPEIQEVVDEDTVFCTPCGRELDYTPSVLAVHNIRRHEELVDEREENAAEVGVEFLHSKEDRWLCRIPNGDYPGGFPIGFLDKVNRKFGIYAKDVLFPFGGATASRSNWTINDIDESVSVDSHHDARDLPDEWSGRFDVVLSDPPYSEQKAEDLYDCDYPRPKQHFVEAARVCRPGGNVLILDWLEYENYCPDVLQRERNIAVSVGVNNRIRVLNVFRKRGSSTGWFDAE